MEELPKTEQEIRQKIADATGQDATPDSEKSLEISEVPGAVGSYVEEIFGGAFGGSTVETADNKKEGLAQKVLNRFRKLNPHQEIIEKEAA